MYILTFLNDIYVNACQHVLYINIMYSPHIIIIIIIIYAFSDQGELYKIMMYWHFLDERGTYW